MAEVALLSQNISAEQAQAVSKALVMRLYSQPKPDKKYRLEITEGDETRHDAQNSLMWHWNREVSEQKPGHKQNWVHGFSKLEYLLPLYKSWGGAALRRAEFIEDVLARLPSYDIKVGVAYDMVRTKNLGVKRFSEYLNEFEQNWSAHGVRLTTGDDLYYEAMGLVR